MGYKMVFSDMDGTLLWKGLHISVENKNAIWKTVDKGIDFVICTGRGIFGVKPHLQELGLIGKKDMSFARMVHLFMIWRICH